jgi:glucokinase
MCLVVSTGVGAGLIVDGVLRLGPSGNAGHLGHITVDVEGEECPCGSRGCVETMSSGTSITRWAVQHGWRHAASQPAPASALAAQGVAAAAVSAARSTSAAAHSDNVVVAAQTIAQAAAPLAATAAIGNAVTAADIAASARAGDEIALAAFERAGRALAAGIAAAATLVDLRVAVVGGGVAKAGPVLFDPLRRHLARYASLPFTRDLEVLPATLGGDAGLIGAAAALANGRPQD